LASDLLNKLDQSLTESGYKSWNVKELGILAGILKTAIEGERTALGLPNNVSSTNIQVPKQEVNLPIEVIQEIDRLFEINSRPILVN